MEFPFGHPQHHHQHHHHRREEDDGEEREELPPPFPFPPPSVHHISHQPNFFEPPPPPFFDPHPAPPPPHLPSPYEAPHEWEEGRRRRPAYSDDAEYEGDEGGSVNRQQTVRVFTKAEERYSLSIRDGKVVLSREDPRDDSQHWIKDMRYSTKVKDEESFPAFALVNKATGEAIKHSIGATHPVQLVPYNPKFLDESVLWTESRDLGDGFRCIRMVNNISLNFDAFNGDEDHGGVHEGTVVVLWEWLKGKNQRWKIVPY